MKVDIYYGKVSENGCGDIDILLVKNFDIEKNNLDQFIESKKEEMLKGWSNVQKGDHIEVFVFFENGDAYAYCFDLLKGGNYETI